MLLTASGPRSVCKDIGSGAVAARRVGNVFHDRGFAGVFLRHLMQTGGRKHMTMNRLHCDIQLPGCQRGHMLLEHPKTMLPVAEDIVHSPDVSAWKSACPPRRSGGCALGRRGQRFAGVARRPVGVVSSSSGRRARHMPSPDEVRGRGLASRFAPSACQQVQRVLPFGGLPGRGRA